ncbi:VOC family protein [Streptococcus porcinus]|uniref:Bleomycin resistance protein n=2 Tax=Streptococcus porcinus TaxID=1340 RepID=A0A4V0H9Y9_STRPO|nr:VOC family protein [Streptococcus porcinus]SQG44571.1 bleomycin resistance protein [Streptococcus porcinus]VTT44627.1 bleomycin resistance protein [Streptococcus porcinus]VTT45995.1 bleomycin resistance protein [Streptococcus porcinus]
MNRINLICLGVRNMEDSVKFYRDGLGFETKERRTSPEVIFFNNAGTKLELYPIEELAADFGNGLPTLLEEHFNGMTLAYNVRTKEEVFQVIALAKAAGARILKEPQSVFWGGFHAYFADPDAYVWEVCWNPEMAFDDQGMVIV